MSRLLTITAVIEAAAGVGLLILPSTVILMLLAVPLETTATITVGRIGGAALLALGIACWVARDETQSHGGRGMFAAMIFYNIGAVLILGAAGVGSQPVGIALWPAVALHAVMAVWCGVSLTEANRHRAV
jgi:hypothetical protein